MAFPVFSLSLWSNQTVDPSQTIPDFAGRPRQPQIRNRRSSYGITLAHIQSQTGQGSPVTRLPVARLPVARFRGHIYFPDRIVASSSLIVGSPVRKPCWTRNRSAASVVSRKYSFFLVKLKKP